MFASLKRNRILFKPVGIFATCRFRYQATFSLKIKRLIDEIDDISATGLKPDSKYTLVSHTRLESENKFYSFAHYNSDSVGKISLQCNESIGGLYTGFEPMGYLWSMKPSPLNKRPWARFVHKRSELPVVVKLQLYDGILNDFDEISRCKPLCEDKLEKWYIAENVTKISIDDDNLRATLFLPPGEPPFPGVISMYGGALTISHEFRPALLASRGFATLNLEFIRGIESFTKGIELEILENAVNYMLSHDKVKSGKGVGVIGISKGGSMSLAMAAYIPGVKCAICVNGLIFSENTRFTYKGREWAFNPMRLDMFEEDSRVKGTYLMEKCFQTPPDPENDLANGLIEFYKQKNVAIMYSASMDDCNLPSMYYAEHSEKLLKKYEHPDFEVIRYKGAGHLLEPPYTPLCQASFTPLIDKVLLWGGNPLDHCRAQELAWKNHLNFLNKHLR